GRPGRRRYTANARARKRQSAEGRDHGFEGGGVGNGALGDPGGAAAFAARRGEGRLEERAGVQVAVVGRGEEHARRAGGGGDVGGAGEGSDGVRDRAGLVEVVAVHSLHDPACAVRVGGGAVHERAGAVRRQL